MPRLDFDHFTQWITAAAREHSHQLADHVVERTGASRRAVQAMLRRLVEANWLVREGGTTYRLPPAVFNAQYESVEAE